MKPPRSYWHRQVLPLLLLCLLDCGGSVAAVMPVPTANTAHPPQLLQLLVEATPADHVLVLTDGDTGDGVSSAAYAASLSRLNHTMSWFSCATAKVTTINKEAQRTRLTAVLVMCPTVDVLRIFKEVYDRFLERRYVWWAVMGYNVTLMEQLLPKLREGVQMVFVLRAHEDHKRYKLFRADVGQDNLIRFDNVGQWSAASATKGNLSRSRSLRQVYQDPMILYKNFNGRQLIIAALPTITFFNYTALPNGTFVPNGGIDVAIVNTMALMYNFTYSIMEPKDRVWGSVQRDGTTTGLVGAVANRRAHFSICKVTITADRAEVIDYTVAYYTEGYSIVSSAPYIVGQSLSILKPYSWTVWYCLIGVAIVIGPVTFLLDRIGSKARFAFVLNGNIEPNKGNTSVFSGNNFQNYGNSEPNRENILSHPENVIYQKYKGEIPTSQIPNYYFNLVQVLIMQHNSIYTAVFSVRLLNAFWYLFILVIICLYASSLIAVYAVPTYSKTLDSLEEVVAAGKRGEVIPLLNFQNSLDYKFKASAPGTLYRSIIDLNKPGITYNYPVETGARYEILKRGGYTSFNSYADARALTLQGGASNYYIGKEQFFPHSLAIALPLGSLWKDAFDVILLSLVEGGLPSMFLEERLKQLLGIKLYMAGQFANKHSDLEEFSISLNHLQGAFFMLMGGVILGLLALSMEICMWKWRLKKNVHFDIEAS